VYLRDEVSPSEWFEPWIPPADTHSHLGREESDVKPWTWAGNWWKNKKEDGENLT